MKPAPFEYLAPQTLNEALALLQQRGSEAKVLAGGQSLMPLLNFRLLKPGALVDINGIGELAYIHRAGQTIAIGAGTRQSSLLTSEAVHRACPLLSEAAPFIGHPATRNRGTVGGSIVHADPAAELAIAAVALDAQIVLRSVRGERTVPATQFFVSYFTTALEADELLTEVRFPSLGPRTGCGFLEVTRVHGGFAVVAVAAVVTLNRRGQCEKASVALGGVGGIPVRAPAVEQAITNTEATTDVLRHAAELVKGEIEPESDVHASREYRRHLAAVLTRRALQVAVERAQAR